jgi:hypothetical protein
METLYLMRHARYRLHGPLLKSEVKPLLSQHPPLNDWEVCGHLGTWVSMDNEEKLKQDYLELWKELQVPSFSWKELFHKKKS